MYERVVRQPRRRRDRRYWICLAVAVVLLLSVLIPILWSVWYRHRWYTFVSDLSNSTAYAYENGTLRAATASGTGVVKPSQCYTFFSMVTAPGSGRLTRAPAGEPTLTLDYGDGSRVEIWDVPLANPRNNRTRGLCLCYTGTDGGQYTYDTDRLTAERICLSLGLY